MTDTKPPLPADEIQDIGTNATENTEPVRPAPPLPPAEPAPPPPPARAAVATVPRSIGDPLAKSPGLALFLSIFFPGLGHIYVGAYERALMIIGAIAVSIWAMVQTDGRLWPLAFMIAFTYFFGLFDAYREAQISNISAEEELPKPRRDGEGRLVFGVFLTVVAGLVLGDNLGLFDIRWLYDWWPAIILLIGLYFIGSWVWEKAKASGSSVDSYTDD